MPPRSRQEGGGRAGEGRGRENDRRCEARSAVAQVLRAVAALDVPAEGLRGLAALAELGQAAAVGDALQPVWKTKGFVRGKLGGGHSVLKQEQTLFKDLRR